MNYMILYVVFEVGTGERLSCGRKHEPSPSAAWLSGLPKLEPVASHRRGVRCCWCFPAGFLPFRDCSNSNFVKQPSPVVQSFGQSRSTSQDLWFLVDTCRVPLSQKASDELHAYLSVGHDDAGGWMCIPSFWFGVLAFVSESFRIFKMPWRPQTSHGGVTIATDVWWHECKNWYVSH